MLTHPTLDQLRALKLDGMAQAFLELEAQEESRNLAHPELMLTEKTPAPSLSAQSASIRSHKRHAEFAAGGADVASHTPAPQSEPKQSYHFDRTSHFCND